MKREVISLKNCRRGCVALERHNVVSLLLVSLFHFLMRYIPYEIRERHKEASQGIYFLKLPNGILQPIDHTATHTATQTAARDVLCKNLNNHAADCTAPVCCSSLVLARACKCDFETLNFLACIFQQFWIFINNKSLRAQVTRYNFKLVLVLFMVLGSMRN